jgi:hypothetical protein
MFFQIRTSVSLLNMSNIPSEERFTNESYPGCNSNKEFQFFPPRRPGFEPRFGHVEFVVEKG